MKEGKYRAKERGNQEKGGQGGLKGRELGQKCGVWVVVMKLSSFLIQFKKIFIPSFDYLVLEVVVFFKI